MKKSILSFVSILALSGISYAGGDIEPVEEVAVPVIDSNPFYLGLGFGQSYVNNDFTNEKITNNTVMLQAGYQYNEYVALEGRYTFGFNTDYNSGITGNFFNDYNGDYSSWGLYVKPMYPIGDFNIYALLGYGGVKLDDLVLGDAYEDGFQWGLGASYTINENFSVFADYVSLYDDTGFDYRAQLHNIDADTWTVGVSYTF